MAAGEKSRRELLREGDRGSCRPSGLISQSRVRWTRAHDRTDGDDHGCHRPPQHWKTAGSIGKNANVCASRARTMDRTNQTSSIAFAHQETTAVARIIRAIASSRREVWTRSVPKPDCLAAAKRGTRPSLTGRCKCADRTDRGPRLETGQRESSPASLRLNRPRTVRCAAGILIGAGAVLATPAHLLLRCLRAEIMALRLLWRTGLIPRIGRAQQRRQPVGCR
ncbi:hypothetical protein ABIB87_001203 [Bradyrhizobium sp. JR18.2]